MEITRKSFPPIIPDNEEAYFKLLEAVLGSVDEFCTCEIMGMITGYLVRVSPSHPEYFPSLLRGIKTFNSTLGIQVEFSKSMKTSSTIVFILNNKI